MGSIYCKTTLSLVIEANMEDIHEIKWLDS